MIRVASSPGGEKSRRNKNDRCPRASSPVLAKFSRRGRLPFTSYQLPSYSTVHHRFRLVSVNLLLSKRNSLS
jgi:hypothetical protein